MFANGPGDWGSISGRVIPKNQKRVLDAYLLNTQHYKVWIKGKVSQTIDEHSNHYAKRSIRPIDVTLTGTTTLSSVW